MDVIEADGFDTKRTTVDVLRIYTAQRYSVIVSMSQEVQDYWVHAAVDVSAWPEKNTSSFYSEAWAVLRYNGSGGLVF